MAQGAGKNVAGIYGTTNWHWSLENVLALVMLVQTHSFNRSVRSMASLLHRRHTQHTVRHFYMLTHVNVRAHSTHVAFRSSEDFEFDGLGNGPTLYRGSDHQCFKDALVVRGKENPDSQFDLLETVDITPRSAYI